jgi:cysteine synthase
MFVPDGILGCIGNTPLIRCPMLRPKGGADMYLKLEGFNASGSVKARAAKQMVEAAVQRGDVSLKQPFVEPSSGNLGLALALVSGARARRCILVVDPRMTKYSEAIMHAYGAEVVCVSQPDKEGSWQGSRLEQAQKIVAEQQAHLFFQYSNPDNQQAHYETTGVEIIDQLGGVPDVCVVGVSTGGQISGIGRRLKQTGSCRIVAVDVEGSSIFGGKYTPYYLRGLGLSWWPSNLNADYIDAVYRLKEELAFLSAILLARRTGILSGGSAGAILAVAMKEAMSIGPDGRVVAMVPERGDRYLEQFYNPEWMVSKGYRSELNIATWLEWCAKLETLPQHDWRPK